MSNNYKCSICGKAAYYDGRCGDGPVLMCGCDRAGSRWVDDGRGGFWTNPTGAKPVDAKDDFRSHKGKTKRRIIIIEEPDDWGY